MPALVPDEPWEAVRPLLPPHPPLLQGGRPRVDDRACLTGRVFLLRAGLAWRFRPLELGCGSPATVWRRQPEWAARGVRPAVHARLPEALGEAGQVGPDDAVVDSARVRAGKGGRTPAPTRPTGARPAASGTS